MKITKVFISSFLKNFKYYLFFYFKADFDDLMNAIRGGNIYKRGERRNKMPSTSTAAHLEKFTFHRERMFSQD